MATVQDEIERLLLEIAELRASCKRLVLAADADAAAHRMVLCDRVAEMVRPEPALPLREIAAELANAYGDGAQCLGRI